MSLRTAASLLLLVLALALAGCGGESGAEGVPPAPAAPAEPAAEPAEPETASEQRFPDVLAAEARANADGTFRFDVTVSSPYDTPERYADAWRVLGSDGTVYGVRELLHDHAGEQPFTRSLDGVEIPEGVEMVTVEGRDLAYGWGGATVDVQLAE